MTPSVHATLPQAFFLPTGERNCFCLFHPTHHEAGRGSVLYLHPLAEELNSTRRVVAQQARALARAGFSVLQIDLSGCGDSDGHFEDATWEGWLQDARQAHRWLRERATGPLCLWGTRAGALLAVALANDVAEPCDFLFWQPAVDGHQLLQQFLRLHTASQWLGPGQANARRPAEMLARGESVDVAGYTLSAALARGMAAARLHPTPQYKGRLVWLEMSVQAEPVLGLASKQCLNLWSEAGWAISAQAVTGPSFWQTVTSDDAPALLRTTLELLTSDTSTP